MPLDRDFCLAVPLPPLLPPAPSSTGGGEGAIIEVRRAVRFAMSNFWASASLHILEIMTMDASEVPVLAMISAWGCPFLRERMSLPMLRRVLTVP